MLRHYASKNDSKSFPPSSSPLVRFHFSRRHVISLREFSHRSSLQLLTRYAPCKKQKAGPLLGWSLGWVNSRVCGPSVALSSTSVMASIYSRKSDQASGFHWPDLDYKTKSMVHDAAWDVDGLSARYVIPRPLQYLKHRVHIIHTYMHACIHTHIRTYIHTFIPCIQTLVMVTTGCGIRHKTQNMQIQVTNLEQSPSAEGIPQLFKKLLALYRTRRFITVFTTPYHLSLS
jgi:hypothetical protein